MATNNRGELIFDGLLTEQFRNKPNIKAYCMAFITEMDELLLACEESYYGRFLENATGEALDIIGIILNQSRDVVLPDNFFGFQGATGATKMAGAATPTDGGIFKSASESGFTVTPLTDKLYRQLLKTKAHVMNNDDCSTETMYECVTILLDRALSSLGVTFPASRQVQLDITASEVTAQEESLILYSSKFFIPTGVVFTINRV